jgi:hypothetical protein
MERNILFYKKAIRSNRQTMHLTILSESTCRTANWSRSMSVQWFEFKTGHATLDDLVDRVCVPCGNVWWIQIPVEEGSDNDVAKRWRDRKWPRAMAYLQPSLIDALGQQK